ncbi:MAG: hypothetical protein AB7F86_08485 [Bdellovibrionales bacterium]
MTKIESVRFRLVCAALVPLIGTFCGLPLAEAHKGAKDIGHLECASGLVLGSTGWLQRESVTSEELSNWSENQTAAMVINSVGDVIERLKNAPPEVVDILLLARLVDFSAAGGFDIAKFVRTLSQSPGLSDAEIVIGQDLPSVGKWIGNILALKKAASPEVREWFAPIARSPSKLLILAKLVGDLREAGFHDSGYNPRVGLLPIQLEWFRRILAGSETLRSFATQSPALAVKFVHHYLTLEQALSSLKHAQGRFSSRLGADRAGRSIVRIEKRDQWDKEDQVEWLAEQLVPTGAATVVDGQEVPSAWRDDLKRIQRFLATPLKKMSKYGLHASIGDVVLTNTVLSVMGEHHGAVENHHPSVNENSRYFGTMYIREVYRHTSLRTASLPTAILASARLAGSQLALPVDITKTLPGALAKTVVQNLREYFPAHRIHTASIASPVVESVSVDLKEDATQGPVDLTLPQPEPILELAVVPSPTLPSTDLNDFAEGRAALEDLKPDVGYSVSFRRTQSQFHGPQVIKFSPRAIKDMQNFQTKEVSSSSWFKAISMGIAAPFGQRGIKFLNGSVAHGREGLRVEVKLLLTPQRLFGRYQDGVFYFDHIADEH